MIQLTGRANYAEYGRALGREAELLDNPKLVETDNDLCVDAAGWYWAKCGLNGLEDRRRLLKRVKALLAR